MAKAWAAFYDRVVPDVPGAPLPVVADALREAAVEFCELSRAWRVDHTPADLVAGTGTYPFAPPVGTLVWDVISAWVAGCPLKPASEDMLDARLARDWRTRRGEARFFYRPDETNIRLVYLPCANVAGGLTMQVTLKPAPDAASVDDRLFNEYREPIALGAKSRLMLSPAKPYSNPSLGAIYYQEFKVRAAEVALRVEQRFTRAPLRTRPAFSVEGTWRN